LTNIYPYQQKNITVQGHKLAYIDEGAGDTVVMVHGNPTWSFYYRNLVAALKGGFRVIAPDHLGCGNSDKPQDYPYCLESHIENLETLLGEIKGPISLVVHDWGGAIGMGYAVRHPEKIGSLVILNTAAFPLNRIPWRINICRIPILGEIIIRGFNGFAYPATVMAVERPLAPEVKRGYLGPYDSWRNRVAVHRFVRDIPMNPRHPSWPTLSAIEAGLTKLRAKPMLIVWGGRDFCFNDYFYEEWRRRFPKARREYLPEAGHYVLEDGHGVVEPLIRQFLLDTVSRHD